MRRSNGRNRPTLRTPFRRRAKIVPTHIAQSELPSARLRRRIDHQIPGKIEKITISGQYGVVATVTFV